MTTSTSTALPAHSGERRAVDWRLRLVALATIWGTSFLFIKVAVQALAPLQITLGRCLLGAVAVAAVVAVRRDKIPHEPRVWAHLAVVAVLLNVVPFTLFGYAEQRIPSAVAGIANATTPLATVLVALTVLPDERPTRRRITGLLVGFGGVAVVLGVWRGVGGDTLGAGMAMLAALCYGIGWVYVRRFLSGTGYSTFALTGSQLTMATAQLFILNTTLTTMPAHLPVKVVLSVAALGALGTGIAYVLQYSIIRDAGATVASTVTYLVPLVAVALGILVLGEQLTWNEPVGALAVLLGAALVSHLPLLPRSRNFRRFVGVSPQFRLLGRIRRGVPRIR